MRMRVALLCVLAANVVGAETPTLPELKRAADTITPENLLRHIRELSSDAYAGRFPGTPGEEKSVAWIIAQAKSIGLAPGTPTGTWIQRVPLIGTRSRGTLSFSSGGKTLNAMPGQDFVLWSNLPDPRVEVKDSGLVFVGYGVVAPEYDWNDYAGVDVKGKTVVILSGDPPVADPADPAKLDPKRFLAEALTVYGRAGTKQNTAFQHGAAAVLTVNAAQTGAGLNQNNARENMTLRDGRERLQVHAQALLTTAKAVEVFSAAGADFHSLVAAAAKPGFRPVALGASVTMTVNTDVRQFESQNVLAKIDGSDDRLKNEYVVYSGHWDHHGQEGDQIFHGASDNAAGTAGVLELARAFMALRPAPKRTLIFFWPTAEEKGLLGARWYVDHPLYPLADTVANINLDYFSNWGWGRTSDFSIVGLGNSTLDDLTADAVARQNRTLTGDTAPEQGFFFRSDHLEFTRVGVPALETSPGIAYVGRPADYGVQKRAEYIRNDYHKASDVVKPDWDLTGAVEDLQILLEVGYRVAQQPERPTWKPDAVWRPQAR
jgi:Zn-dependent M28 family amino/carboxypeptidase